MAFYDKFPYTNFQELNLDWILKQVKATNGEIETLYELLTAGLHDHVDQYIQENLSQFLLGAMYDEENTAIKLQQVEVIGSTDHVYNSSQENIIVMEGR